MTEQLAFPDWQPHLVETEEYLDPGPVAALASIFDDGLPTPGPGDPLPPLWHWVALPRWSPSTTLSSDGHPRRGGFLPPVELPRRMFAGGTVRLPGVLRVGATVRRRSRVDSVVRKSGRSGELVLVETTTELLADDELALVEKQNLIYRAAAPAPERLPDPAPAAALVPVGAPLTRSDDESWSFRTDPTVLARFSAATANAHRIHYDWPYATGVEGYPGLVVHGPLMSLTLAQTHRHDDAGRRVTELRHRNSAPLFCGQDAEIRTATIDSGRTVTLLRGDAPAVTLDLTLA